MYRVVGLYSTRSAIFRIETFSKPYLTNNCMEASKIIFLISSLCFSFLSKIPMAFVYIANIMNSVNKSFEFKNNSFFFSVMSVVILCLFDD